MPKPSMPFFILSRPPLGLDCDEASAPTAAKSACATATIFAPAYPRDLCHAIRAIALYEDRKPIVTRADFDRAAAGYFI